jgi:hypothetical protein
VQIEVIIEGKGSITIADEKKLDRRDLRKLAEQCAEILRSAGGHRVGFGTADD